MKGIDLNKFRIYWMANKKAWVTTDIFNECFEKCFVPKVRLYINVKGLELKDLLILVNTPAHETSKCLICFR